MTTATADPTDVYLPMLASQAAIEVDNVLLGRAQELNALKKLVEFLRTSFSQEISTSPDRMNLDTRAASIVGMALSASGSSAEINTVSELFNEAWQIADSMEKTGANSDEKDMQRVRSFCVALSSGASTYWHADQDLRPSNPLKR